MTSAAARRGVRRFRIAARALGGSSIGVGVGRAVLALVGARCGGVGAVPAGRAAGRDGRVGHSAHFNRFDEQRFRLAATNPHGFPLEHVQAGRQLHRFTGPPFAFLGDCRPPDFIPTSRHALAEFILCL